MTKDVISLSISVLLLFRHYISHKITFGAPSSGGVLCSACGAFILLISYTSFQNIVHTHVFFYTGHLSKEILKVPCMEKSWNLKNLNNHGKIMEFCEII